MALFRNYYDAQAPLGILDVSNPVKPVLDCTLSPAEGGRFLSATKIAFSTQDKLGTVDLASGRVTQTAQLASVAGGGAFSPDGSAFAYRVADDAGVVTGHLFVAGADRILYVQEPIGGHGGPGPDFGPFDQIAFSPDGSELLDYMLFRPPSGPANLLVFRLDGSLAFQQSASLGVWAATGSTLYFSVPHVGMSPTTELDSIDATGQRSIVATGLNAAYAWPELAPDHSSIVYNAPDNSIPDCGGLPHLWRLDLATGKTAQLSKPVSSTPTYIGPTVVWSNEEKLGGCGPGGPSVPDGVILAHDVLTGTDSPVDLSFYSALGGGSQPPYVTTVWVLDTRF